MSTAPPPDIDIDTEVEVESFRPPRTGRQLARDAAAWGAAGAGIVGGAWLLVSVVVRLIFGTHPLDVHPDEAAWVAAWLALPGAGFGLFTGLVVGLSRGRSVITLTLCG